MQTRSNNNAAVSRPRDDSFQAYKAWITEIAKKLTTGKNAIKLTEAEWIESWQEFSKQKLKH